MHSQDSALCIYLSVRLAERSCRQRWTLCVSYMIWTYLQELIIQNFAAKKGTAMENHPEPQLSELQWTIAMARLIFGPNMNIQAPPNLTPGWLTNLDGTI